MIELRATKIYFILNIGLPKVMFTKVLSYLNFHIPGPPSQTIFSNFARVHTYIDWGYLLDIYSNQNSSTIFGIL